MPTPKIIHKSLKTRAAIIALCSIMVLGTASVFADFDLDVDKDGETKALTDGLIILRYLFGFRGESLTQNALGEDAVRTQPTEIIDYLDQSGTALDIDGDSNQAALTDGLLILRDLFGFDGPSLTQGACLLYTSPSPRDKRQSRMPSSA